MLHVKKKAYIYTIVNDMVAHIPDAIANKVMRSGDVTATSFSIASENVSHHIVEENTTDSKHKFLKSFFNTVHTMLLDGKLSVAPCYMFYFGHLAACIDAQKEYSELLQNNCSPNKEKSVTNIFDLSGNIIVHPKIVLENFVNGKNKPLPTKEVCHDLRAILDKCDKSDKIYEKFEKYVKNNYFNICPFYEKYKDMLCYDKSKSLTINFDRIDDMDKDKLSEMCKDIRKSESIIAKQINKSIRDYALSFNFASNKAVAYTFLYKMSDVYDASTDVIKDASQAIKADMKSPMEIDGEAI